MIEPFVAGTPSLVASAPGELPPTDVMRRASARRRQFRHDNTLSPLAPRVGEETDVWAVSGDQMRIEVAALWYALGGEEPNSDAMCVPMEIDGVTWDPLAGYLTRWRGRIPAQVAATVVRYRIGGWSSVAASTMSPPEAWAQDGQGFWFQVPAASGLTTFAYRVEPPGPSLPDWVRDAVVYQIFLDRFHPGTLGGQWEHDGAPMGIHGGTLRGVRRALPYFADLGVSCLWLSPLYPSPSYHRYDATDYYSVDPALGTKDDLRGLVDDAHDRGMRVIMDFVPAHCSRDHPAFRDAQANQASPTASWFNFTDHPDSYRMFLNSVPSLPSINAQDPSARAHLIDSAVEWLVGCGIDGFRIDHAIGVGMDFYVALRAAMLTVKPDSFTVGEVTDTPDCLRRYRNRLGAVLDFPLARALRLTFAHSQWDVSAFCTFLDAYDRYMESGPGRLSFLDNHDMNRFLFAAGNRVERLKLAALCQFTLVPTPIVYYGTEVGLTQEHDIEVRGFGGDAEARRDMPWDSARWNEDLRAFYRSLTVLRSERPMLREGERRTVYVETLSSSFAYTLSTANEIDAGTMLVAFNLGEEPARIPLPDGMAWNWVQLIGTGSAARVSHDYLVVPPLTGVVMLAA